MKGSVSQIGPYRLDEKIGTGGMGSIYRGVQQGAAGFERPVAVKILHPHLAGDQEYVRMFRAEALLAARLAHPVLVPVRDLGVAEGTHYMVMDLLEGATLAGLYGRYRKRGKPFPRGHALWVLAQVLDGLHYAHELCDEDGQSLGVVHRDVSPRNIFVTGSGAVRLVDFGIARVETEAGHTQIGVVKGTVPYMAPEQALGQRPDRRADIFAVGVLLHELLTDQIPLDSEKTDAQRKDLALMEVRPRLKDIHVHVRSVVARALQPRVEDRYQTAAEMAAALREALVRLEPEHEPQRLGAMASLSGRRRSRIRPKDTADPGGDSEQRPSRSHRGSRADRPAREPEGRLSDPGSVPEADQPPATSYDGARTLALLASLVLLAGLLYTFLPASL